MDTQHDWLLIGSAQSEEPYAMRLYHFRCKWCNAEETAFDIVGPPVKRYMLDNCDHEQRRKA